MKIEKEVINRIQSVLNLKNWHLDVSEEEALDGDGKCKTLTNEYRAIITIRKELCMEEKLITLIHEMLHVSFRDQYDIAIENLEDKTIAGLWLRFHERSIQDLSKSIYNMLNISGWLKPI